MLTAVLILLPLLLSVPLFISSSQNNKSLALGSSIISLLVSIAACVMFQKNAEVQFGFELNWVPSLGLTLKAGIDGISIIPVLLTNLLVPFIILTADSLLQKVDRPNLFLGLVLLMQSALVGVFTSFDAFLFYVFWELALIPIYLICLMWGGENRIQITLKFFVYTMIGSLLMLIGLVYLYQHTAGEPHSFDLQAMYAAGKALPAEKQGLVFWLIFMAFAIKMPVFPFHSWQPDTYTNAPTQGTMLLSGIMLKMGTYGLIRWLIPVVPAGVATWGNTAVILSIIGILYAAMMAIVQSDYKRLIAYSSFSHVGLIAAGIFALNMQGMQGALYQMLSHGINVVALFYIIQLIEERTGTRKLSELGGIRGIAPNFATAFMIVMLGSVALPLTNGFVGEFFLISGIYQYNAWYAAFAGLTVILGAVYMLRSYQQSMLGEATQVSVFADLNSNEKLILYSMVVLIFALGVFPQPILDLSEPAVKHLLEQARIN